MLGRRTIQGIAESELIDVSTLNPGVYVLILHTSEGSMKHLFTKE